MLKAGVQANAGMSLLTVLLVPVEVQVKRCRTEQYTESKMLPATASSVFQPRFSATPHNSPPDQVTGHGPVRDDHAGVLSHAEACQCASASCNATQQAKT